MTPGKSFAHYSDSPRHNVPTELDSEQTRVELAGAHDPAELEGGGTLEDRKERPAL